ncbi:MAG: HAD-IA family hydrolase [Thermomicrobiales bacterium]
MQHGLLIFDCDGVLVDSEGLSTDTLIKVLAQYRVSVSGDAARRFRGRKLADILSEISREAQIELPATLAEEFRFEMDRAFERALKPVNGIAAALQRINSLKCVVSNGPRAKILRSLELTGLSQYFSGRLFSAYDVGAWKPDPRLFVHAARSCGVHPSNCIVIEDSLPGVQAGISAGMKVMAFAPAADGDDFRRLGATTFAEMASLPDLLRAELT